MNHNKQIRNNLNSAISFLASLAQYHILFHLKHSFWFHQTSVQEWTQGRLEAWVCWKMLYLGNVFQLIQSTKNTEECAGVTWSNYLLPRKAGKLIQSSWIRDRRVSSADKSLEGSKNPYFYLQVCSVDCWISISFAITETLHSPTVRRLCQWHHCPDMMIKPTIPTSLHITRAFSYSSRCSP